MRRMGAHRGAEYDNPRLYSSSFQIRQQQDAGWVFGLLSGGSFRNCLDLGCGNGDFLARMLQAGRITERIVALDQSEAMVEAARDRLAPLSAGVGLSLHCGDILAPPRLEEKFALVTMLAVQHWLYPREEEAYCWILSRLEDDGAFCLTTYHPRVSGKQAGGSDEVILEAMEMIGLPAEFPSGFVPMGQRARPAHEVQALLQRHFHIAATHQRRAETRAESAEQFSDYHRATFGTYFSRLVPERIRADFHDAVGKAAMRRMEKLGYVTSMAVRCWICRKKSGT